MTWSSCLRCVHLCWSFCQEGHHTVSDPLVPWLPLLSLKELWNERQITQGWIIDDVGKSIVKEKCISVHQGMLVVPEAVSFSPSAAASSAFLPLFIPELTLTASTPRRHTTRTHNTTRAAEKQNNYNLSNASIQCTKVKCCTSMQDTQEGISYIMEN